MKYKDTILNKLVKIASNQQKMLEKIAQALPVPATSGASNDMDQFMQHNFTSWGMPLEVAGKVAHSIRIESGSKHYDINAILTLAPQSKSKKMLAEDPQRGLAAFLDRKFKEASAAGGPFEGYTATFHVTAN